MSERVLHLQRQQALLREHLAWIDAEIAKESAAAGVVQSSPVSPESVPAASPTPSVSDADAEALIKRYAADERQNSGDIRRGCLMCFFAALLLLAGGVVLAWWVYYR